MESLLKMLADRLGVAPPRAGEAITPTLRFEHPLPQIVWILLPILSIVLIVWLYRREGAVSWPYKAILASLRITLVLLAMLMLSELVLSVERTGLPTFVILVDDSASQQIVDHPADPKLKEAAASISNIPLTDSSGPRRIDVAKGLLTRDQGKLLDELRKDHKLKLYLLSAAARPLAAIDREEELPSVLDSIRKIEPSGPQSRLGAGLRQVLTELRGAAPTAVLLLTDGQTTEGESLDKVAELAARKEVPIFTVGLGDPEPPRDLELAELLVDEVAFVDDLIRFQAKILSHGYTGQELTIKLGERVPGTDQVTPLQTQRVTAPVDGQPKPIEIGHRPKQTGDITYVLEIVRQDREQSTENNVISRVITIRKEKLKVLLVDGQPRYEYRYLKNFLEREESIDLSVVLLSSDPEYSEQDRSALPTFPTSKESLFTYDVVVFGDADPSYLTSSQYTNLVEFVTDKGGGLLFIAGELFNPLDLAGTPLLDLLPIELTEARDPTAVGNAINGFRPVLTIEGRAHPIFRFGEDEASSLQIWQNLPELLWFFEAPRKKPGAFVLAEHPEVKGADGPLPLILYQYFGSGKTMFSAVDDTWRWRFRVGDRYFGRYWIQTIRFLARSKLLGQKLAEVTTDRKRYQRSQPVQLRVRFPNPGVVPVGNEIAVQVERKGQGPRRIVLKNSPNSRNLFEGAMPQGSEGEYLVQLLPPPVLPGVIPSTTFRIDPPAGELERTQLNQAELIKTAEVSGGKFYQPQTLDTLLADLPKPQKVPLDTDPPIPLWNTWPMLALFLALLTAEWVLRKRKQMV